MNIFKPYNFILSIIAILGVVVHISHAQNSPQDYVNEHNHARASVGVGKIRWDDHIAAYAKQCANKRKHDCSLEPSSNGPYGENLANGSGAFLTGRAAVKLWVNDQKSNYDYATNTCAHGKQCGAYTQVVWKASVRIGCARVRCDNGLFLVVCNYDPPGNFFGERPY